MMKRVLLYLWQLPQNLLALFLLHVCLRCRHSSRYDFYIHYHKHLSSFTLGEYIVVRYSLLVKRTLQRIVKHEMGHREQSRRLGWLYLFVIGIPSVVGNVVCRLNKKIDYYELPWEKWADSLGGVTDEDR